MNRVAIGLRIAVLTVAAEALLHSTRDWTVSHALDAFSAELSVPRERSH